MLDLLVNGPYGNEFGDLRLSICFFISYLVCRYRLASSTFFIHQREVGIDEIIFNTKLFFFSLRDGHSGLRGEKCRAHALVQKHREFYYY